MEVPFVLLCAIIMVSSFPVNRGEHDFADNSKVSDMAIDETSNSILVHNTFHLPPIDEMRASEIFEKTQFPMSLDDKNRPMLRASVPTVHDDRHNTPSSDGMRVMESKIDWLVKSNKQILQILQALEHKVNRTLETAAYQDQHHEHSAISPRSTIDLMDNMEVMNLLNNIHQFIIASNGKAKQPDILEADQIQVIKNFVSAIENEKRNNVRLSSPDVVNQVLTNSRKTIEHLDKVSAMVEVIDERTIRIFDQSCRQLTNLSNGNRNGECICDNGMIRKNRHDDTKKSRNVGYERTYRNMKRDTNWVHFEPNKYNCHDLQVRKNGVYKFGSQDEVSNEAGRFFYERYCDFNTDGPSWTVIQRRYMNNQPENFNRSWLDYKLGFGELDREFWFGNDFIHQLTFDEDVELRIVLEDTNGRKGWAKYSLFRVDSEEYNYNLIISGYRGSIQHGPFHHNDQEFSTYDRQNDNNDNLSCASLYGNGWWFNNCTQIPSLDNKEMTWEHWLGSNSLKSSKMMIRPRGLWSGGDSSEDGYIFTSSTVDS